MESVCRFLCGSVFLILLRMYLGLQLLGHVVALFVLRNFQTVFQSVCAILHFYQQSVRVSPYPCKHFFVLYIFLIRAMLGV